MASYYRELIANQDVQRYPRLAQSIEDATKDFLAEGLVPAEAMISSLVDCQLAHINTSHPDFIGGSRAVSQLMERMHAEHAKQAGADGKGPAKSSSSSSSSSASSSAGVAVNAASSSRSHPLSLQPDRRLDCLLQS